MLRIRAGQATWEIILIGLKIANVIMCVGLTMPFHVAFFSDGNGWLAKGYRVLPLSLELFSFLAPVFGAWVKGYSPIQRIVLWLTGFFTGILIIGSVAAQGWINAEGGGNNTFLSFLPEGMPDWLRFPVHYAPAVIATVMIGSHLWETGADTWEVVWREDKLRFGWSISAANTILSILTVCAITTCVFQTIPFHRPHFQGAEWIFAYGHWFIPFCLEGAAFLTSWLPAHARAILPRHRVSLYVTAWVLAATTCWFIAAKGWIATADLKLPDGRLAKDVMPDFLSSLRVYATSLLALVMFVSHLLLQGAGVVRAIAEKWHEPPLKTEASGDSPRPIYPRPVS